MPNKADESGKFRPDSGENAQPRPDVRRLVRSVSFMEDERARFRERVKEISRDIGLLSTSEDFYRSLAEIYDGIDQLSNLLKHQSPYTTLESEQGAIAEIALLRDKFAKKRTVIAPHSRFNFTSSHDYGSTAEDSKDFHHKHAPTSSGYGGSSKAQTEKFFDKSQGQAPDRFRASDSSLPQDRNSIQGISGDRFEKISYGEFYGERLKDKEGWKSHYSPPRASEREELQWKSPSHRSPNLYGEEFPDVLVLHPGYPDFKENFCSLFADSSSPAACEMFMDGTIPDFVGNELAPGTETDLPKLVVLCGSIYNVWATTCEEFVARKWPDHEAGILEVFKLLARLRLAPETQKPNIRIPAGTLYKDSNANNFVGRIDNPGERTRYYLRLKSQPAEVAVFFEAVAWLFTVTQSTTDGIFFSACSMTHEAHLDSDTFRLSNHYNASIMKYASSWQSNCWLPLVPNTPISVDFGSRIRPRGIKGLELSFELMCYLCGVEYHVVEDGVLVLYGSRAFVYPVHQTNDCVEWHLQLLDGDTQEPSEKPGSRLKVDDLATICEFKRHFIGLWTDPRVTLGTEFSDVSKIAWSQAADMPQEMISDSRSIGGIFTLPKFFGFSWVESFKVGRTRKNLLITEDASFEAKILGLINVPVLLYCASEKRAWLVSYLSVLLHLARSRAHVQRDLGYSIPACALSADGGRAAFDLIKQCYERPLKVQAPREVLRERDRAFTIEKYLNIVMAGMECLKREKLKARGLFRSRIMGYDMAALAGCEHEAHMKTQEMEAFSHGWTPLLAEVDLVLFYEGVYDPIVSSMHLQHNSDCLGGRWPTIPAGSNVLTASLPCLRSACKRFNVGESMASINREYMWHNPGRSRRVFEECCNRPRVCNKLQELRSERSTQLGLCGPAVPPSDTDLRNNPSGAVIFRYSDDLETIERRLRDQGRYHRVIPARTGPGLAAPLDPEVGSGRSDSGYSSTDQHRAGFALPLPPPRPRAALMPPSVVLCEDFDAVYPSQTQQFLEDLQRNRGQQAAVMHGALRAPQEQPRPERRYPEQTRRVRVVHEQPNLSQNRGSARRRKKKKQQTGSCVIF